MKYNCIKLIIWHEGPAKKNKLQNQKDFSMNSCPMKFYNKLCCKLHFLVGYFLKLMCLIQISKSHLVILSKSIPLVQASVPKLVNWVENSAFGINEVVVEFPYVFYCYFSVPDIVYSITRNTSLQKTCQKGCLNCSL